MKQVFSIVCAAFLSMALLVTSCKKGDTGPEGPEGPAGPGGPSGAQGPKGDAGTANVIYSNWEPVGYEKLYDTIDLANNIIDSFYFGGMDAPKLTQAILDRGEIKVYINLGRSDQESIVVPLPFSEQGAEIVPRFVEEAILFRASYDASTLSNQAQTIFQRQYRYILIPGGQAARSAIDWNDYKAVKAYLKLPD